jgi:glycosyltransferase involved in cell wall biosynthesis
MKVTIAIPTYNMSNFLEETIDSCLNQTYSNFDLYIIDNASEDKTAEIVRPYLDDHRVTYICNDINIGMVNNWNKCLNVGDGELVKILNADDILDIEYLENCIIEFNDKKVALVASEFEHFGKINKQHKFPVLGLESNKEIIANMFKYDNYIGSPSNVIMRREALRGLIFRLDFPYAPDWVFWSEVMLRGEVRLIRKSLCGFRRHEQQATSYLATIEVAGKIDSITFIAKLFLENSLLNSTEFKNGLKTYSRRLLGSYLKKQHINMSSKCKVILYYCKCRFTL